ncbi:MAG: MBL fold metallo-hydrolase [Pirellulales bacterium]
MFDKTRFLFAFVLCLCVFGSLRAEQASRPSGRPAAEAITVKQVRGNLYHGGGGGGNAFFYVAPDEVLVVDAKMTGQAAAQIIAAVKKASDKPVRRVILTHSDGDHVNGLGGLPAGFAIISHLNARQDIAQANASGALKLPLPNEAFDGQLSLFLGDAQVQLRYFGPAHTNGDVVVYLPGEKTAIVGDLVFIGRDPLIHANKHGSSAGLVSALQAVLKLDADLFLSGHADPVDRKAVEALLAKIQETQAKVKALVQQGKTLDEVKTALAVPQPSAGSRWPSLVEIVYRELTEKK